MLCKVVSAYNYNPSNVQHSPFDIFPQELFFKICKYIAHAKSLNALSLASKASSLKVKYFKIYALSLFHDVKIDSFSKLQKKVQRVFFKTIRMLEEVSNQNDFYKIGSRFNALYSFFLENGWNQKISSNSTTFSVLCLKLVNIKEKKTFHKQYFDLLQKVVSQGKEIDFNNPDIVAPPLLAVATVFAKSVEEMEYINNLFKLLLKAGADPLQIYKKSMFSDRPTCVYCQLKKDNKEKLLLTAQAHSHDDLDLLSREHQCYISKSIKDLFNPMCEFFFWKKPL